ARLRVVRSRLRTVRRPVVKRAAKASRVKRWQVGAVKAAAKGWNNAKASAGILGMGTPLARGSACWIPPPRYRPGGAPVSPLDLPHHHPTNQKPNFLAAAPH